MKIKLTSSVILTAVALLCAASFSQGAEKKEPAAQQKKQKAPPLPGAGTGGTTPHATTSAVIGPSRNEGGMITITYGRPHAVHPRKGGEPRKVWGGLVPYEKADRLGADEATVLLNEYPIEIAGTTIPSGAYTLYRRTPSILCRPKPGLQSWRSANTSRNGAYQSTKRRTLCGLI
jgi:hypothetical protein